jgi:hypothetical protein
VNEGVNRFSFTVLQYPQSKNVNIDLNLSDPIKKKEEGRDAMGRTDFC